MGDAGPSWDLEVPAVPASLDPVQDMVALMYDSVEDDLNAVDRIRFETALVEVVGNVIEHGVPAVPDRALTLRVTVRRVGRDLVGVVVDDGRAVDIDLTRNRETTAGLDEVSGRGLSMALALSSELRYQRNADLNEWTVICTCE